MKTLKIVVVAGLMLGGGTAAVAKTEAKDPNRQVCRSTMQTGSHFATRTCRTQAEWDAQARRNQDDQLRSEQERNARYDTGEREGMSNTPR